MEDTIKKKIIIVSFSKDVKSKNKEFIFDICEYMTRKSGKDKDGNEFVTYPTKTGFTSLEIAPDVPVEELKFGAVCIGEFGEVYDSEHRVTVLGLVGISALVKPSPMELEEAFAK